MTRLARRRCFGSAGCCPSACLGGKRKEAAQDRAVREYLAAVIKAHLHAMLDEPWLPDQQGSERRLAEVIESAISAAGDPRVAELAGRYDRILTDLCYVGHTAERARRWLEW